MNINIACVFNPDIIPGKIKYTVEWVDKLYRGIKRNLSIPFRFVCLTNEVTDYETIPLVTNSIGYWNKIELFKKGMFSGPTLYFDLDVVICNDITPILEQIPKNKFLMVQEPYKNIHNSSMMFWNGDYSHLFDRYQSQKKEIVWEYQYNLSRPGWLGDQAYIGENITHELIEDYVDAKFIGWCHHKVHVEIDNPSILIFTSEQKPSNNLHLDIVKKNWI